MSYADLLQLIHAAAFFCFLRFLFTRSSFCIVIVCYQLHNCISDLNMSWKWLLMILQDEQNCVTEDYFSFSGSTRESWGRCSSLGLCDEESYPDFRDDDNGSEVSLSLSPHAHTAHNLLSIALLKILRPNMKYC